MKNIERFLQSSDLLIKAGKFWLICMKDSIFSKRKEKFLAPNYARKDFKHTYLSRTDAVDFTAVTLKKNVINNCFQKTLKIRSFDLIYFTICLPETSKLTVTRVRHK